MAKATLHVIRHPVVQHKLTLMRSKGTSVTEFRALASEVAMLMAYENEKRGRFRIGYSIWDIGYGVGWKD